MVSLFPFTPNTRRLKVLNQVKKGSEYKKKGLLEAALLCFKKGIVNLSNQ
jgi:hypothetical protein